MSPLMLPAPAVQVPIRIDLTDEESESLIEMKFEDLIQLMVIVTRQTLTSIVPEDSHPLPEYGATRRYPARDRRKTLKYGSCYGFMSEADIKRATSLKNKNFL
jgi:hypothetical protein